MHNKKYWSLRWSALILAKCQHTSWHYKKINIWKYPVSTEQLFIMSQISIIDAQSSDLRDGLVARSIKVSMRFYPCKIATCHAIASCSEFPFNFPVVLIEWNHSIKFIAFYTLGIMHNNELILIINGNEHRVLNVNPEMTLLYFLRENGYTGCKLGCAEGGCGACTVAVTSFDVSSNSEHTFSVNACLAPLCSMAYKYVETVEGIGSVQKPHPIQVILLAN